jgi:hypothetical protein
MADMPIRFLGLLALSCTLPLASSASAGVERVEVIERGPAFGGREFGEVGTYERIAGTIHFAYDPKAAANARIVDLGLAPPDEDGLVRARANFRALRPAAPENGSGTALLEVSNRGGAASLRYFNRAPRLQAPRGEDPLTDPAGAGDGLLMRAGLTLIHVGWQYDVPGFEGALRLEVPRARRLTIQGAPSVTGLVRADWVVDEPTTTLALGHRGHEAYPAIDPTDPANKLTWRAGRKSPRRAVPRGEWSFGEERDGKVLASRTHITSTKGFEAGLIYELVYRSENPAIVGLGLAAIRDTIAFAKHGEDCPFTVERGLAVGISQTGRFLRHFLYEGFNVDEDGRRAFDGMLIHSAGAGRGSFNHRFAQPSRDAHRYSAFFYPTDLFPFSGRAQRDPITRKRDGLLSALAPEHRPRIMYTNTGYEYWGRAAALLHTSLFATADVEPLPEERIYHLASGQHFVVPLPTEDMPSLYPIADATVRGWRGNPLDFLWTERALLLALQRWVEDGTPPPPSAYPRIENGTLVPVAELAFPDIRSFGPPALAHEAYRVDYGEAWERERVIYVQPPKLGAAFPILVPQVDRFGNERGGVPSVETLAPLATYTPWCLRVGMAGGNGELFDFWGGFFPLPRNKTEQRAGGDTRPTTEESYVSKQAWFEQAQEAARLLVARGFLLEEDTPAVLSQAERTWDFVHKQPQLEIQYR